MPLPTERISLNQRENSILRAGLNRILNRFGELRHSRRLKPELLNPALQHKLQPRSLAPGTIELFLSLRNRLAAAGGEKRSKHRFSVVEYAALAFAARVERRLAKIPLPEKLTTKIENYRKRAKRRAITLCGREAYGDAADQWRRSSRWIRFYVLPLLSGRGSESGSRRMYRELFHKMLSLARNVIAERCTEPLKDQELSRLVRLIVREIRRGCHGGITVLELLRDELKAKDFLFGLIKKKQPDLKLKFEFKSLCEQQAERGDRFRAALVVKDSGNTSASQDRLRFPQEATLYTAARFLRRNLNRGAWNEMLALADAVARVSTTLKKNQLVPDTLTLDQIMTASRPPWEHKMEIRDILEYNAAWLVHFFMQAGATPEEAVGLLKRAVELAVQLGQGVPPNGILSEIYRTA